MTDQSTFSHISSVWSPAAVAAIDASPVPTLPLITAADAQPALRGIDLWDMWPVQYADGRTARFDGNELWMVLSAPGGADPGHRHGIARIRLLQHHGHIWTDCGDVLPEGFSPGSREWAGSAVVTAAHDRLTLYFTASGRRGEAHPTFEQRLFETVGHLSMHSGRARVSDWSPAVESVASDGHWYDVAAEKDGEPGLIKAFRDPAYFRDPADGRDYLLFTGSKGQSPHDFSGVVGIAASRGELGIAASRGGNWSLMPPLVTADGLNNELERPHVIVHDGLYYLFWSTQRRVFAPAGPSGPNGLYGMVAPALTGPYRPLNGTGLVAANPEHEPLQAYSWWVTDTLQVASFIDHWGLQGRSFDDHPQLLRGQFGGTPAPRFSIALSGDSASIVAP